MTDDFIHKAETKKIAGFVLAGGRSSRMGQDKALLDLAGEPLFSRAARLIEGVIGAPAEIVGAQREGFPDLTFVPDDWPDAGPLGGIATALRVTSADWNLIVACDMPYLTRAWLEFLVQRAHRSSSDVVLAENYGRLDPLCAMYHKRSEPALRGALERGMRKVTEVLQSVRLDKIAPAEWRAFDSDGCLFKNVNSPADYEEAKRRLG